MVESEPATFANPSVLEFYRQLPFNYHESAQAQAELIRKRDAVRGYSALLPLLGPGTKVLEVGCGAGWFALSLAFHHGCEVTAIDFNPVAIARARAIAELMNQRIRFEIADLFLYEPENPADLVVSLGVLHHTNNCMHAVERLCDRFVRPGGHVFLGLYHALGRRPFLDHFARLKQRSASEEELFQEYRSLHSWLKDDTFARSWFRDQVQHPHETQHTLAELLPVLQHCGMTLQATSINGFAPFDRVELLIEIENGLDQAGRAALAKRTYYPGFFVVLAKAQST